MMDESGLIYHPNSMNIKRDDLKDSLLALKNYVKSKDKLWYTVIDDSDINEDWINENLVDLKF
jgi:rhamnogalacturonyl hydrolase YesR